MAGAPSFFRRLPPYVYVTAGGTVLAAGSLYAAFLDRVPITGRQRWLVTSRATEERLGHAEHNRLRQQFGKKLLPASHRAVKTLHRVGDRLSQAAEMWKEGDDQVAKTKSRRRNSCYTYHVVRDDDVANAFVLPGNHVYLFTGLLRYIKNEDDLAAVLAHETAHNVARHVGERLSRSMVTSIVTQLLWWWDPTLASVWIPASTLLRDLPHSRLHESEADKIGLELAAAACFDPRAALRVFGAMQQSDDGQQPPEFLSTHPSTAHRLQQLQAALPAIERTYQNNSDCAQIRADMRAARRMAGQPQRPS